MISGNTSETGDVGESPGKSSLFFLTTLLDLGLAALVSDRQVVSVVDDR